MVYFHVGANLGSPQGLCQHRPVRLVPEIHDDEKQRYFYDVDGLEIGILEVIFAIKLV